MSNRKKLLRIQKFLVKQQNFQRKLALTAVLIAIGYIVLIIVFPQKIQHIHISGNQYLEIPTGFSLFEDFLGLIVLIIVALITGLIINSNQNPSIFKVLKKPQLNIMNSVTVSKLVYQCIIQLSYQKKLAKVDKRKYNKASGIEKLKIGNDYLKHVNLIKTLNKFNRKHPI